MSPQENPKQGSALTLTSKTLERKRKSAEEIIVVGVAEESGDGSFYILDLVPCGPGGVVHVSKDDVEISPLKKDVCSDGSEIELSTIKIKRNSPILVVQQSTATDEIIRRLGQWSLNPELMTCSSETDRSSAPVATEYLPQLAQSLSPERTSAASGEEPKFEELFREPDVGIFSLRGVCDVYYEGCVCGHSYPNNCAHFLSNAFIRAGYTDLLTSSTVSERCAQRRPIRAQDMLRWFQAKQTRFYNGRISQNTGIWATYQEKPGWRHVVVIDTDRWLHYGTGDYWDWPVQYNYKF